jgi:hypothetical protein
LRRRSPTASSAWSKLCKGDGVTLYEAVTPADWQEGAILVKADGTDRY